MSNSLGIATVTSSLRAVLENAFKSDDNFDDALPNALVTTLLPIAIAASGLPDVGANIFLFQVTPNAAGRNLDLPTRGPQGDLVARPRVALDLHYMITFYGSDDLLEPQRLLGLTIRAFNRKPLLSPTLVNQAVTQLISSNPALGFLSRSNLAAAIEPVRLTPIAMPVDELARLWSLFSFQSKFSLSVVYVASMLFVDTDDAARTALPVISTNVYVDAGGPPEIDRILPAGDPTAPITPGVALSIIGRGFGTKATDVQVLIDGSEVAATSVTPVQIDLTLPDLAAGTHGLQIARPRFMGTPPTRHQGLLSNLVPLVLRPVVDVSVGNAPTVFFVFTSPADPNDDPAPEVINSVTVVSGHLQVKVTPAVGSGQTVVVYLNELQLVSGTTARAYTIPVEMTPGTPPSVTLTARFRRVVPGTYMVRIQVDGATSTLTIDSSGRFTGPTVEVTSP